MHIFRLPFTHATPAALARRAVQRAMASWNVRNQTSDDVLLVTTELVQNAIQHGGDGGELRVELAPDAILIEVSDISPELPTPAEPAPGALRGRGLHLVTAVTRRWGARRRAGGGKVVWAELPLTL